MATGDKLVTLDGLKAVYDSTKAMAATTEASATASTAHAVESYFILSGVLYQTTADIASGGTITPGTNCKAIALCDEVSTIKDGLNLSSVKMYPHVYGNLSGSGWNNLNQNYQHIVIPIKSGDEISLAMGDGTLYYAVLKSYNGPSGAVDFSAYTGFTSRKEVNTTTPYASFIVPQDANYLLLQVRYNTYKYPSSLIINGSEYAKDARAVMTGIDNKCKQHFTGADVLPFSEMDEYYGYPNNEKKWGNFYGTYKFKVIACGANSSFSITAGSNAVSYGILKSFTIPDQGAAVPYSDNTSWNSRKTVAAGETVTDTTPSDGNYLLIVTLNNGTPTVPASIIINGIDYIKTVYGNLKEAVSVINGNLQEKLDMDDAKKIIFDGIYQPQSWESGTFTQTVGQQSTNSASTKRQRMVAAVKYPYPITIMTDGVFSTDLALYDDDLILRRKFTYSTETKYVAANTYFRLIIADAVDDTTNISAYTSAYINAHVSVKNNQIANLVEPGVNWCAMGDSITEGYVSYWDDVEEKGTSKIDRLNGWAYKAARINNWNLTNLGIGGTGWDKPTNEQEQQGVDTTSAHYVARHTDFTPYNLVTLAYGINDWKDNRVTGSIDDPYSTPTTTIGGMRATLDAIIDSNPHCKIIVILPLNCMGYHFEFIDDPPTYNWALGYSFSNSGTLEQFVQALISVCDYYGIQYIDMTHYSCINRNNIQDCLTDGVHPNEETHEILARELCRKITFG